MAAITLKNGHRVSQEVLDTTLYALRAVDAKSTSVLGDLVKKCSNASYRISPTGESGRFLRQCNLMDDKGEISSDVKSIVMCAIEGESHSMRLVSPIEPSRTSAIRK